jgi:hypothetical protein
VAAFLAPSLTEEAFPGRELVPALPVAAALSAWGLRHAPRIGGALVAVTLAASLWLLAAARRRRRRVARPARGRAAVGGPRARRRRGRRRDDRLPARSELLRERELR